MRHRLLIALLASSLLFAACGTSGGNDYSSSNDDPSTTSADDDTSSTVQTATTRPASGSKWVSATLTDTAIEGIPKAVDAGLLDVTVTDETTDEGALGELNFTLVEKGTTEDELMTALAKTFQGGPFPDFMLNTAGVVYDGTIILEEGSYILWTNTSLGIDRVLKPDDMVSATMTVEPGTTGAKLPEADGTITATDYAFDIDVPPGEATVNFTNASTEQYHHVFLMDLGTTDPALVDKHLEEILTSDPEDLPDGIDGSAMGLDVGSSTDFGPGSTGTIVTYLTPGHTYVALCDTSDVAGGAPHSIQHDQVEIFTAN